MSLEKHTLLKKLNEAYASGDVEFIAGCVTDDIQWHLAGQTTIKGKKDFLAEMQNMSKDARQEITISRIITHGIDACVEGKITMADTSGSVSRFAFCDVYKFNKFKAGKVKDIVSYVVSIDK